MGLGEEYNSVAETEDSGLFFQWWDGINIRKYGEVRIYQVRQSEGETC